MDLVGYHRITVLFACLLLHVNNCTNLGYAIYIIPSFPQFPTAPLLMWMLGNCVKFNA